MNIINFNVVKDKYKQKTIEELYNKAIDLFGKNKFITNIKIDLTSKALRGFLTAIYEVYEQKGIIRFYKDDMVTYLNNAVQISISKDVPITKDALFDSMVCDLYETRIKQYKEKNNERTRHHGRKCN